MRLFNNLPILLFCRGLHQALASFQLHNISNLPESPTGLPSASEIVSHAHENAQSGLCVSLGAEPNRFAFTFSANP